MGSGSYSASAYQKRAKVASTQSQQENFSRSRIHSSLNPTQITTGFRESCISEGRTNLLPVIVAFDITGSMGRIPDDMIKGPLGRIFQDLNNNDSIDNPQILFAGIGDSRDGDQAPIQVTQFESDNKAFDQLQNIYLEGYGGPFGKESYNLAWYFAAYHTTLESLEKNGQKGVIFTMGDEGCHGELTATEIRRFINPSYTGGDVSNSTILAALREKYHVFHIDIAFSRNYIRNAMNIHLNTDELLVANSINDISTLIVENSARCVNQFTNQPIDMDKVKEELEKNKSFVCPISHEVFTNPVICCDGKTYEKNQIQQVMNSAGSNGWKSPLTNSIIQDKSMIPNAQIRQNIQDTRQKIIDRLLQEQQSGANDANLEMSDAEPNTSSIMGSFASIFTSSTASSSSSASSSSASSSTDPSSILAEQGLNL